jgi:hypothetical protein
MGATATEAPIMVFPDDSLQTGDHCEICGGELSAEVIIQEFADGSIARLCAECAAGASLDAEGDEFVDVFPDDLEPDREDLGAASAPTNSAAARVAEPDPMEKTRELLTPVVDLITLQHEMQGALQRLAASLETFATGVISENLDKTATVEGRLESLERELEQTRARLRETEALLIASGAAAPATQPAATEEHPAAVAAAAAAVAALAARPEDAGGPVAGSDEPQWPEMPGETAAAAGPQEDWDLDATAETVPAQAFLAAAIPTAGALSEETEAAGSAPVAETGAAPEAAAAIPSAGPDLQSTLPPVAPPPVPPPVAPPAGEHHARPGFQLSEVQLAQRYFNESTFTARIRDVRRSLGKPKANLTRLVGVEPRALLTITWDIIWYQYLVDLRRDASGEERVTLHREGMDLEELSAIFKEKNASVDDEGRLDASELEVKLLSDPSTLITEMTPDEEKALEDATEEIWDQRTAPEFKWDD